MSNSQIGPEIKLFVKFFRYALLRLVYVGFRFGAALGGSVGQPPLKCFVAALKTTVMGLCRDPT